MKINKYLILLITIALFIISTPVFALDENETEKLPHDPEQTTILYGDVNDDGSVNVMDILQLRLYFARKTTDINKDNADANGDGSVNVMDILQLRLYFARKIPQLGPTE